MTCATRMLLAILLLAISCVSCASPQGTPPLNVSLPAPPKFMAACPPSPVKIGDAPNQAFDLEHAALKQCSRQGAQSRAWYVRVRQRYAGGKK